MWWLSLVLLLAVPGWMAAATASPWPREPGERFNRAEFDAFWSEKKDHAFRQLTTREYLEVGLNEQLTVGGQLATVTQLAEGPGYVYDRYGIVEADLFINLHTNQTADKAHGWQLSGGLPTAKFDNNARVMGQDSYVGLARLLGVSRRQWFATSQLGGRISLGDDADQVRCDLAVGIQTDRLLFLVRSFNTVAVSTAHETGTDYDLGQVSLSAVAKVRPHIRIEWGARIDAYSRTVTPGQSVFFSIWWTS